MAYNLGNDDLDIHIAAPEGWTFAPGDPIIGTIVRRSRLVTPEASVWVALRGELKVTNSNPPGYHQMGVTNNGSVTGTSKQLLDPKKHVLFRGPLNINGEDNVGSWPFEFRVPYSPWVSNSESNANERADHGSELPGYQEEEHQLLPASFHVYGTTSCWARYFVDTEIRYIVGGAPKTHTATLNVQLKTPPVAFEGFGSQHGKVPGIVQGNHLLRGKDEGSSSSKSKRHSFFYASYGPEFHFELDIEAPETIQLNNREPFPLRFRVTTLKKTNSAIRDNPPEIALSSLKMSLQSSTYIRYHQRYLPSGLYDTRSVFHTHKLGIDNAFKNLASTCPLRIPSGEKEEPLDIGDLLQHTLTPNGLMAGRTPIRRGIVIVPDMIAAYTKHKHTLEIEFTLAIAGKTDERRWDCPVQIV
ncbi:hypothetical protein N7456_001286 [Penicillium angulare]|uniref:Arrestin-like N-terminal domain-containing protein n=1 Tax=Penicillium angulare TaxID=116970 RepID=A0A9W9GDL8_9EURO|nr:hypothetical protein N7456_001286 [Penicillium angulare]